MKIRLFLFVLLCYSILYADGECPFCDPAIINRQEVYHGNHWRVLLDYKPVLEGHVLLIPIAHRLTRHELSQEEHNELYEIEKMVHCVFLNRFGPKVEDFQYEKNGPTLQSVNHFHIHVLPFEGKMKSFGEKIRLFSRLFLFPPSPLSEDQFALEKSQMQTLFKECQL